MESFSKLIGGRWKTTSQSGNDTFDTWTWGPGRHSIRCMTEGIAADGKPWHAIAVYYWDPGRSEIRLLAISPFQRSVSEGSVTVEHNRFTGFMDLFQTGGRREMGLQWTFEGPDTYADELREKDRGKYAELASWKRTRVGADAPAKLRSNTSPLDAQPSARLGPLVKLLGRAWMTSTDPNGKPGTEGEGQTQAVFEYVPYADAIYGRVNTLPKGDAPAHAMDLYLFHHTGAGVLRCLALGSNERGDAAVYQGDIASLESGRTLECELKARGGAGGSKLKIRVEFESSTLAFERLWKIDGDQPTLQNEHRYRAETK